jgi:hexosaminidase
LELSEKNNINTISFQLDPSVNLKFEGYILEITPTNIIIKANAENGLFYGLQSLIQLIPQKGIKNIQALHIEDEPRFPWRGMMIDASRHNWSVSFIKRFIDQLAYHKLNKFHWHLTDDQGWRIEIKKYPRLQEIAAWRSGSQIGRDRTKNDGIKYGGYYTQEQIKEVVAYATSHYVEVIPEIEMPGHSVAAVAAYPNLACFPMQFDDGKEHAMPTNWAISKDIYCAGNDEVFEFLQNVLTEVMTLFPSQYIHIGGDEAPHGAWAKCPKCQKRIKDEGLKDEAELQSWFLRRMEKFINSKGKRLIGWEEIMLGGLSPTATVHSWINVNSGITASKMGNDVIMSPSTHLYFDGYQADSRIEPLAIGYFVPLDTVYSFEPRDPKMSDNDAKHLLGAQGNVWTEFIGTVKYFEYMTFPRVDALSEVCWTPSKKKNFTDFKSRLKNQYLKYDKIGINYRIPTPKLISKSLKNGNIRVSLENETATGIIRFEIDKENVTNSSPIYKIPIELKKSSILYFSTFLQNNKQSSIDYFPMKAKSK